SRCTRCNKLLKCYELVPIFSFLFQKGKCRYCGESISPQYPFVEFLNGLLYLILYYRFNLGLDFIFYSIIFSILIVISFIDINFQVIPNSINVLLFITAILYKIFQHLLYSTWPKMFNSILGLIISGGVFLLIAILSKGGIGGGDIKLIGVLGFILGFKMSILNMVLSFLLGAIISVFLLLLNIKEIRDQIPFGPFICLSFIVTVLWGNKIIYWYLFIIWGE